MARPRWGAAGPLLLVLLLTTAVGAFVVVPSPASPMHAQRAAAKPLSPAGPTAAQTNTRPRMLLNGWGGAGSPFSFQSPAATAKPKRRADGLDTDVVICGTGIAGLALAADLERRGVDYLVVEKARYGMVWHGMA